MSTYWRLAIAACVGLTSMVAVVPRTPSVEPVILEARVLSARLSHLERQAQLLSNSATEIESTYVRDVRPIEKQLRKRAIRQDMAFATAWAIVHEANKRHLDPALVAAVMTVENPWLLPDTVSYAGAVGLMQVMPLHVQGDRAYRCGADLTDGATSVCYGTDILRQYIGEALDTAIYTALLRYNGCISTPGCEAYAAIVLNRMQ